MNEVVVGGITFIVLIAASFGSLLNNARLLPKHLQDDTNNTIRLVANLFVVVTSLMLGLLMNSAKNAFETNERNVHAFATELILLDRTIRELGPDGEEAHRHLREYLETIVRDPSIVLENQEAERLLTQVGAGLKTLKSSDDQQIVLWNDARELYRRVVRGRWVIIEEATGNLPRPLIAILIAWLVLIFASYGYRAPRNAIVATSFVCSAFLISASIYIILDLDDPSSGIIHTSNEPIRHALAEARR